MSTILAGLGSNLGDRLPNLQQGVEALRRTGFALEAVSSVYQTEPVDCPDPLLWFLNCAVRLETRLGPWEALRAFHEVEELAGRRRPYRHAPRTLDLDLLFYGEGVYRTPELEIPHPRLAGRRFVLVPLAEIAPHFFHPELGFTIEELLARCPDTGRVERYCSFPVSCL